MNSSHIAVFLPSLEGGGAERVIVNLITGLHDPLASHLAMLYAIAPMDRVRAGYAEAVREGYLWHEFGDSHLLLGRSRPAG